MSNKVQNLLIDDGLVRLNINDNGLLVFNPTDLNLYHRYMEFVQVLPEIEKKYLAEVEVPTENASDIALVGQQLAIAKEIDADVKKRLGDVFGGADFDKLLDGVNMMAFGRNGERIIANLLGALRPYIEDGVEQHTSDTVAKAKLNREQRRAMQKKAAKK